MWPFVVVTVVVELSHWLVTWTIVVTSTVTCQNSKYTQLFPSLSPCSETPESPDERLMAKMVEKKTVTESPPTFEAPSDRTSDHFILSSPQYGQSQTTQINHHPYLRRTQCLCTHQETGCGACQRLKTHEQAGARTSEDIADSFNTLRVTTDTVPHRTISCRQQEAAYSNYSGRYTLDDTTVDELAGYLEEMMYLPQPMSEMAELMYTW